MFLAIEREGGPFRATTRVVVDGSSFGITRDGVESTLEPLTLAERAALERLLPDVAASRRRFIRRHGRPAMDPSSTTIELIDGTARHVVTFASGDEPVRALRELLRAVQRLEQSRTQSEATSASIETQT